MSTTTILKASKATALAQLQALVSGLQKELPNGSFTLMSTTYTTSTLVPVIQAVIAALTAVDTAEAGAKAALVDFEAEAAKTGPLIADLKRTLVTMFSNSPDTLAVFALKPRKARAPLTAAKKAAAAVKAKATREARGTAGKKQKSAVTGNVTGVIITPVVAPAPQPAAPQLVTPATPVTPTGRVGQ